MQIAFLCLSVFVLVSLRIVSKACWSLVYSGLVSIRYSVFVSFRYCSESDWVVTEISYLEEEMDTSEGWTVVIIFVQAELAYIYRDQKIIMPRLTHPSTSLVDPEFFVLSPISESRGSLLKYTDLSSGYLHQHTPLQIV